MNHILFVYGTLRQGFSNHGLMTGAQCLGPAATREPFALYCGDFPYLCKDTGPTTVRGEVYVVDDARLERIDELEDHPRWYAREEIAVALDSGREVTAWCYFHAAPQGELVASGDVADVLGGVMRSRQSRT